MNIDGFLNFWLRGRTSLLSAMSVNPLQLNLRVNKEKLLTLKSYSLLHSSTPPLKLVGCTSLVGIIPYHCCLAQLEHKGD
jgi:hypothetical protein